MKKMHLFFAFALFISLFAMNSVIFAQNEPVLYFCEKYGRNGEVGVSDRFTTGYLTVVIKNDYALDLDDVAIQYDKYNRRTGDFEYYKKFDFTVEPDMKYIYFERNDESDMEFEEPGFYRVFLLDDRDNTVASALVEIIR
ncbi:hypothetical protein BMS3Abin03_02770 [bacterium BMS3Abin03]|nr:hypothetical protein BMS3Abin03_02770 [bacterium BMS3Abin03]